MNKEEIEEIKSLLFQDRLTQYGKRKLIKYVDYLESKLNKVTDKLKEDANKKIPLAEDMDWVRCRKEHAKEILNIIEGGNIKND